MVVLSGRLWRLTLGSLFVAFCCSAMPSAVGGAVRIAVHPAKFTYVPGGWRVFDRDYAPLTRRGADVESYALSWAYKPNPNGWANRMPPNTIGVNVILIRRTTTNPRANLCGETPHLAAYPPIPHFPLMLPKSTAATQEGEPNIAEYRVFGRFDDLYNIDLRVDINRAHPTRAMLQLAQRVVSGLRFPRWPLLTNC
ncbi:MAG: hypothetical protein QOI08_1458 [Actinomycetota bacterium]|nr:hypothetical protein [Actinomycetota bacterium]